MKNLFAIVLITALTFGCAQVPRQSVELSATVGRDIAEVHEAHRSMALLLFDRMRDDVNRFIDDIYAPQQIRAAMDRQEVLANSSDAKDRRKSLLLAMTAAFKPGASDKLKSSVLKGMEVMVRLIREDIENRRQDLLAPLNAQEKKIVGAIDRAYQKIHHANSIVTGHLASVAKVQDAQQELLNKIGVETDLRKMIGVNLSDASEKVSKLLKKARKTEGSLDKAEEAAGKLKEILEKI